MSRTSAAQIKDGEIHCQCGKTLAKPDGIQCRCGLKANAIHFRPDNAISGGSIEADWQVHFDRARVVGCTICGIQPQWETEIYDPKRANRIHFRLVSALGGGSIESDWRSHREQSRIVGCGICGIKPDSPLPGQTTDERFFAMQELLQGRRMTHEMMDRGRAAALTMEQGLNPEIVVDEPVLGSVAVLVPTVAEPPIASHALASLFMRVPASLDTIGQDYPLPQFAPADPTLLAGIRVLVISADGAELPEIAVPIQYLKDRGADVQLAGQDWIFQWRNPAAHIVIAEWLSDRICVKADLRMSDVNLPDFDAVFIPGGAWNPDMLRTDEVALRLVRQAHRQGLLVASLCHGPQVLINAAFDAPQGQENFPSTGVHITGTGSIRRDLKNAGFIVHDDQPTVYDEHANLLTARDPNDLGPLCEKLGELLQARLRARKSA